MIHEFISFELWADQDDGVTNFYDCTVLQPFGKFKVGEKIEVLEFHAYDGYWNTYLDGSGVPIESGQFKMIEEII